MSESRGIEPPGQVSYGLDAARELLGALEDAREVLTDFGHLTVVAELEDQVRRLSRKLGFDDAEGGAHVS